MYISQLQCRHIFWRVTLCKWADPYPEQNESEAVPIKNMAAQWIPNVDDFFDSLVRMIHGARSHLSTDDIDSAVFWSRSLDEYERTLTLLLSRVAESRSNQEIFLRDLQMLIPFIRDLREVLDSRAFWREFEVDGQEYLVLVFTALAPKCKVIRERDTKSHARRTPFSVPTHTERLTEASHNTGNFMPCSFSISVWVL